MSGCFVGLFYTCHKINSIAYMLHFEAQWVWMKRENLTDWRQI